MIKQRPFCDVRPSMAKNPLLVRGKVGRAPPPTQKLPDENFSYGIKTEKGESVKDIFNNWAALEKEPMSSRRPKEFKQQEDFIATNRAAVHNGCTTAREFRTYQVEHPIMQKPKLLAAGQESIEDFKKRTEAMCHGIHSQYIDEMKDCLTFRTARENKERAIAKRQKELEAMKTSKKQTKQAVAQRSMRPTRASRGHQYVPASEPKLSETFKMKRFTEIDHCTIDDKW